MVKPLNAVSVADGFWVLVTNSGTNKKVHNLKPSTWTLNKMLCSLLRLNVRRKQVLSVRSLSWNSWRNSASCQDSSKDEGTKAVLEPSYVRVEGQDDHRGSFSRDSRSRYCFCRGQHGPNKVIPSQETSIFNWEFNKSWWKEEMCKHPNDHNDARNVSSFHARVLWRGDT